jgi:GNAT superfamily N-acetyltransferase
MGFGGMKILEDKKTGLLWCMPEIDCGVIGKADYTNEDKNHTKDIFKEMNGWKSDNISTFITGDKEKLGTMFSAYNKELFDEYFAYESGGLVAVVMLKKPNVLEYDEYRQFKTYLSYKLEDAKKGKCSIKKFLDIDEFNDNYHTHINYLVVSPKVQGRGIGTRVVKSIMNNPNFFREENENIVYSANIHYSNIASRKVFSKNNFSPVNYYDEDGSYTGFSTYFNVI